jgi:hypothetical protein
MGRSSRFDRPSHLSRSHGAVLTRPPAVPARLDGTREICERALRDVDDLAVGRRPLLRAALESLPRVPELPVPESVKDLILDEFAFIALADAGELARHRPGTARFERLERIAALQRFPAGQFEWEIGGVSRRDVLSVSARALPRVAWFVARRMGGLAPVLFSHLNPRRAQRSLSEAEANRSYYRMARALEMQPAVRGFGACSWFRSPATHRVSPHLAWLSTVFLDYGGLVVEAGRDDPDGGALYRSATRRALYAAGRFTPTRGLVLWPRDEMIAWARSHPEYAD